MHYGLHCLGALGFCSLASMLYIQYFHACMQSYMYMYIHVYAHAHVYTVHIHVHVHVNVFVCGIQSEKNTLSLPTRSRKGLLSSHVFLLLLFSSLSTSLTGWRRLRVRSAQNNSQKCKFGV